jgi:RNA polymerase primary sigma factor
MSKDFNQEFDKNNLQLYFSDLKSLELLTAKDEIEFANNLNALKSQMISLFFDYKPFKIIISELKTRPNDYLNISFIHEDIEKDLKTINKLPKRSLRKYVCTLPWRWEFIEEYILIYRQADVTNKQKKKLQKYLDQVIIVRNKFAEGNLRLVIDTLKKLKINSFGNSLSYEDLIQEGNLGLLKSINKFDPSKGLRFSTYSVWWICQAIVRAIADKGRLIRLPVHLQTKESRKSDTFPNQVVVSLDDPVLETEDLTIADSIPSPIETFKQAGDNEIKNKVLLKLSKFAPREEKIMQMYFGFDDRPYTLDEIGMIFGVTRERIRQIKSRTLKKLMADPSISQLVQENNIDHDVDTLSLWYK